MLNSFKHLVNRKSKEETQLEQSIKAVEKDPTNINLRLKLGDLYAKTGDKPAAIQEYTTAAVQYANDGYLVKAIAVNKIIVRLDPARQEALDRLSDLYFQRGITADPLVQSYREAKKQEEAAQTEEGSPDLMGEQQLDIETYLEKLPILNALSDDTKQWLKYHLDVQQYVEGEVIIADEAQQPSLFLLADGHARMITTDKEGQKALVADLESGKFFGGISLIHQVHQHDHQPEEADVDVEAASLCIILEISGDDLQELTKREPDFSEALLTGYHNRQADITLARVPLFSYLEPAARRKIREHLTQAHFKKDAITEGDSGDSMYLIKSGEVGIYTTLVEDEGVSVIKTEQERLHLATLKSGDFFGEQALITKEPRSATVIALTDVELLKFTKPDLAVVVRQFPRVGTLLKKYHQQRIAETLESLKSIW